MPRTHDASAPDVPLAHEAQDTSDAGELLRLDQQVCFGLAVAARSVIGLYRPVLEPLGLTHPQYLVMLALWERAPLSIKEIGELLRLEPATVSPLVKRLETNGLLVRERHPHDDRALQVQLTRRGRDLRTQALTVPPQIVARLGMELSELRTLHEALTRVIAASREPTD